MEAGPRRGSRRKAHETTGWARSTDGGLTWDLSGNAMQNEKTRETAGLSELHSQE